MYIQVKICIYTIVMLITMIALHINYFSICIKYFYQLDHTIILVIAFELIVIFLLHMLVCVDFGNVKLHVLLFNCYKLNYDV